MREEYTTWNPLEGSSRGPYSNTIVAVSQLLRPSFHKYTPPLATTERGRDSPVNQCTVSIWCTIHWSGMPDEYGQNRRYSRYLRGSHASYGRLQRKRFQSVSCSLSAATSWGRRHRPGWFTFQVISAITMSPNLPERMYSLALWEFVALRRWVPICTTRSDFLTASRIAMASSMRWASGFSM